MVPHSLPVGGDGISEGTVGAVPVGGPVEQIQSSVDGGGICIRSGSSVGRRIESPSAGKLGSPRRDDSGGELRVFSDGPGSSEA